MAFVGWLCSLVAKTHSYQHLTSDQLSQGSLSGAARRKRENVLLHISYDFATDSGCSEKKKQNLVAQIRSKAEGKVRYHIFFRL